MGYRLRCSVQASLVSWFVVGIVFCVGYGVYSKSLDGIRLWVVLGSAYFVGGWLTIGMPVAALGETVCRIPMALFVAVVGLLGGIIIVLVTYLSEHPASAGELICSLRAQWEFLALAAGSAGLAGAVYRYRLCRKAI